MFSHGKRMVAEGKNVRFRPFRLFLDGLYFYAHRFSPRRRPLCKLAGRGFQTGYKMRPRRGAKASPGGEAGSPLGLTDEVEAINFRHGLVQTCNLRPHPVRLEPDHRSRGMTATGSHIDFGFAARSTTLQGKALVGATLAAPTAPHPATQKGGHLPPRGRLSSEGRQTSAPIFDAPKS